MENSALEDLGFYKTIKNINNKTLAKYIFIIIIILFFFRKIDIKLNVFLSIFIAIIIIYYLHDKNITNLSDAKIEKDLKLKHIEPKPIKFKDFNDIIDFFFSIQDFYDYNPEVYEEMVDNVNAFLTLYEIIFKGTPNCESEYQIAESKKNNAINCLHSLVFKLPNDKTIMDKYTRAHKRLETILNNYLNIIYDKCHEKIIKQGYNINTRAINLGPTEHNHYFDKDFTYQFY